MSWLGPLLTAGGAAVGRLVAVNLAPTAILAITIWLAVRADAFRTDHLTASNLFVPFALDAGGVLLFVVLLFGLAILLQPFEIRAVRILEGYWSGSRLGAAAAGLAAARHRRRLRMVIDDLDADDPGIEQELIGADRLRGLPIEEQARRHRVWNDARKRASRAKRWRPFYPPSLDDVLPTMLGNVLRASERRAGERYYFPTVETLPRLHQHLSDRMAATYNAAVDALDAAAMMALSTGTAALISVVAYYNDPALYWLPLSLVVASLVSYRGAIVAAAQYGIYLDTAFDLHRFDLIEALHLDLPRDAGDEKLLAERLEDFWKCVIAADAQEAWKDTSYWHYQAKTRALSDSGASNDEDTAEG